MYLTEQELELVLHGIHITVGDMTTKQELMQKIKLINERAKEND